MKCLSIIAIAILSLTACTPTERGAAVGAGIGATAGAITTGTKTGAAVGAAIGGVTGALIGRARDGRCIYRDRRGRTYRAAC
ncbi:glycine zipper domain-containing protein [Pseudahrensia aquimaris]|uniref:Glycine zipper domain-containing protein n=1 Tax=Pseudahrensia aquimaris TaxID=744461 RepID=A0ABW3FFH4_9HYPH